MELVSLSPNPSQSPLPSASLLWQPRPGAWMFTFACKATFILHPVQSPLAPEHEPLYDTDRHWSDDPAWSLYAPADLVPIRPRADVVLVGEAYAPGGQPTRSLVARLLVGEIDKAIEVCGDRWFTQDGALHEGDRFTRMPLLWERAAGGPDTLNPVGMRADQRDAYGRRALPNLQPPGALVSTAADVIEPVCFGPLDPTWPVRRQRLGRHAATFSARGWSTQPLPADLDATYFNAAPRDQQSTQLRDDERLVLDNLHPKHAHLVTNLSGHHPRAFVARAGAAPQPAPLRADLLWVDTVRGLCTLTWRGQIPLESPQEAGQVLLALEEPGQALAWADVARLAPERARAAEPPPALGRTETAAAPLTIDDDDIEEEHDGPPARRHTVVNFGTSAAPVLPFAGAPPAQAAQRASSASSLAGMPFAAPPPSAPVSSAPPLAPPSSPMAAPAPPPLVPVAPAPPPLVPAAPAFVAAPPTPPAPPIALPAPVAQPAPVMPSLVRAPTPRTIGEAAIEAAAPIAPASAPAIAAGAAGASNAAAAAGAPFALPRDEASPARSAPAASSVRPASQPTPESRELLHLLWFDREMSPRFRRHDPWRAIVKELEDEPIDKELDDPALAAEPMAIEDRREAFAILARASSTDIEGLREALEGGERDDGRFVPPIRLLAGDLVLPFQEIDVLRTTVAVATPLMGADENIRAAVASAQEMLKLPELASAPAVAEGLTARVREAWSRGKRPAPEGYLEAQTERALLEQRAYQRRKVFGKKHLRALLTPAGSKEVVPAYLPEELCDALPMYARFRARLIAELHVQVDQQESHPAALRVLALARVTPSLRRR